MKTSQVVVKKIQDLSKAVETLKADKPNVVFIFGGVDHFANGALAAVQAGLPGVEIIGCSTAGEICDDGVFDETVVLTAARFDRTKIKSCSTKITDAAGSEACGADIAKKLAASDLKAVFVLGQGVAINGSTLIKGLKSGLDETVIVTGGLAGDAGRFQKSYTIHNGQVDDRSVVALGLYGDSVKVTYGSRGGWDPFGPTRRVTKAQGTVLFELDGEKALNVYKAYLKDHAKDLPGSGLLFPFALLNDKEAGTGLIRTILGIDEAAGSLILAGDIQEGNLVRLMHAKTGGLVKGAQDAAEHAVKGKGEGGLGLLVSCVGRKLVMGEDVDAEVEAVFENLGAEHITGFYSNGEIGPFTSASDCQLHNQTMTITSISE